MCVYLLCVEDGGPSPRFKDKKYRYYVAWGGAGRRWMVGDRVDATKQLTGLATQRDAERLATRLNRASKGK